MLNINEIRKYYPYLQGFDVDILREYLQYKILDIIFKNKIGNKLSFIGGTAIKICYGSNRFSEDLDFDSFNLTKDEFIELSLMVKKELELNGYLVEITTTFKGAYRCNVKISNLLQNNNLAVAKDEKILIQIDVVPHNFIYQPKNFLLNKFDVFRNIKLTPADILLAMKVFAIFGRKRIKGRDFYDFVYLSGMSDFNYKYLNFKLKINTGDKLKKELQKFTKNLDFNILVNDVKSFLINKDDEQRVLLFREYINQLDFK